MFSFCAFYNFLCNYYSICILFEKLFISTYLKNKYKKRWNSHFLFNINLNLSKLRPVLFSIYKINNPKFKHYYIDHYCFKSTEEYINKINKGDAVFGNNNKTKIHKISLYFGYNKVTSEKINKNKTYIILFCFNEIIKTKTLHPPFNPLFSQWVVLNLIYLLVFPLIMVLRVYIVLFHKILGNLSTTLLLS